MHKRTDKIIALNESILIWDRMYNKYHSDKFNAIEELYNESKISKDDYVFGCPLCEKYWANFCEECPWPGDKRLSTRCTNDDSPYIKWENAVYDGDYIDFKEIKHLAKAVLNLLMSIKIEE